MTDIFYYRAESYNKDQSFVLFYCLSQQGLKACEESKGKGVIYVSNSTSHFVSKDKCSIYF